MRARARRVSSSVLSCRKRGPATSAEPTYVARLAMLAMSSGLRWMKGILMAARGGCTPTVSGQPQLEG